MFELMTDSGSYLQAKSVQMAHRACDVFLQADVAEVIW